MAEGVSETRKAEVETGTWRNPVLSDEAREKLSQPRVHDDNPVLHSALEKLTQGASISDLTPEEQEEHRAYRRRLRAARAEEANAWRRAWYREKMENDPEFREAKRQIWQEQQQRLQQRPPNPRLQKAREQADLSQQALGEAVGVSQTAVSKWERYSVVPRDKDTQKAVEDLLGTEIWPES